MTEQKDTAPLLELRDIWKAMRERLTQQARILVLADAEPGQALATALAQAGMDADAATTAAEAAARSVDAAPELVVVAFGGADDPRAALLGPAARDVDRVALAWAAPGLAVDALRAGADDVLPLTLPLERLARRVRARLRQLVTLELIDRFTVDLRTLARAERPGAVTVGAFRDELKRHARWLEERGKRVLVAWSDGDAVGRAAAQLGTLGASILTAESLEELVEVLHVASIDVALFHAGLAGGAVEGLRAVRAIDPLVQVALFEPPGSAAVVDEALASGAVTAILQPGIAWPAVAAVIRRLLDARQHAVHREKVVHELGRTFPEALDRWRVAREAALTEPAAAARAGGADAEAVAGNRRLDPRVPLALPVEVRPTAPAGSPIAGTVVNLAMGGVFVACDRALAPRSLVECRIAAGDAVLALPGVVVREEQAPAAPQPGLRGFAVRFERLGTTSADALRKLLSRAG
jgi:DNA-binding response OmpR family regulator